VITAIRGWLGSASPRAPFGIGDDCAVLPGSRAAQLVTVDPVIYGEHFNDSIAPRAAGEKLFKRNLSDIAAMGGRPRAAVVALALDARVKLAWLEQFYRGPGRGQSPVPHPDRRRRHCPPPRRHRGDADAGGRGVDSEW
jgi:thiamine-monophosphate kinase